jgi:hypothetical protein
MSWFAPLLAVWDGPGWLLASGWRLTLAALSGVTLGVALQGRAADAALPFPDAAALAELIGWPDNGRRWRILLLAAALAAAARAGVAAGWWPGMVLAAVDGQGWAGLLGVAVAPGLVGLGMVAGWERVAAVAAGSLAVGVVAWPLAREFGPLTALAPGLRPGGEATGLDFQASYAPLIGLGAGAVGVAWWLIRKLRAGWTACGKRERPASGAAARARAFLAPVAAALLGAGALWQLGGAGALPPAGLPLLLAAGAVTAAIAVAVVAHLGSLPLPALGFPALAVGASALALRPVPTAPLLAGALGATAALFAADYLQARRVNLLLEVEWPLYPVKLLSCLAGLGGAALAAGAATAVPVLPALSEAGVVTRTALAGSTGLLPVGLAVSGAGLSCGAILLARPVWPVALGALLPLPAALTVLLGGGIARRREEEARAAGLGLMLGDLLAWGTALFLQAWGLVPPGAGRGADIAVVGAGWAERSVGGLVLALVALAGVILSRRQETRPLPANYAARP